MANDDLSSEQYRSAAFEDFRNTVIYHYREELTADYLGALCDELYNPSCTAQELSDLNDLVWEQIHSTRDVIDMRPYLVRKDLAEIIPTNRIAAYYAHHILDAMGISLGNVE